MGDNWCRCEYCGNIYHYLRDRECSCCQPQKTKINEETKECATPQKDPDNNNISFIRNIKICK